MNEDHVAAGTVEQGGQNLSRVIGAVLTEDALVRDAAGDLHASVGGDLAEDLVEAGVVRRDRKRAVVVGDPRAVCWALRWREGHLRLLGRRGLGRRQSR